MIFSLTLSMMLAATPDILFVGNSHTAFGDVPGTVKSLLQSQKGAGQIQISYQSVSHLNTWERSQTLKNIIYHGGISVAVLQGAEISSSHRYTYSQESGINLARYLTKSGTKVFFVSEWPRRGWDETEYIESTYREMAKQSWAEVIPVGRVWDYVRKNYNNIDLWQSDGNHANQYGAYLSARTIARFLGGDKLNLVPRGIEPQFARVVDQGIDSQME